MSHSWHFTFFDISYAFWILLSFSNFIRVHSFSFIFLGSSRVFQTLYFDILASALVGVLIRFEVPAKWHHHRQSTANVDAEWHHTSPSRLRWKELGSGFHLCTHDFVFFFIFLLVFVTYGKSSWSWSFSQGLDGRVEKLATGTLALRAATRT